MSLIRVQGEIALRSRPPLDAKAERNAKRDSERYDNANGCHEAEDWLVVDGNEGSDRVGEEECASWVVLFDW